MKVLVEKDNRSQVALSGLDIIGLDPMIVVSYDHVAQRYVIFRARRISATKEVAHAE